ncbi:MAG: MarR family transcriptional regulator [Steroidobacteraceae bacterium]
MPVSSLESHLGYWLRFVSNHVAHAMSMRLAEQDVTVAEWVILRELYEHENAVVASRVAQMLGMTRGAISKLIDRLVAKQLVTRHSNETDRRCQSLSLSAAGRAMVPKLSTLADQNDADFFGHLQPAQRELMGEVMKTIVRRKGLRSLPVE